MAKYLDSSGLSQLWTTCKNTFLTPGGGDERYLKLSGGTLSGDLNFSHGSSANDQHITWASGSHYQRITIRDGYADPFIFQYSTDTGATWSNYFTIKNDSALIGANTIYHTGNLPAYPTKASWNYDDRYLQLGGGALTGNLTLYVSNGSDSPKLVWQREELNGVNSYDWSAYDKNGKLYFAISRGNNWEDLFRMDSDGNFYVGNYAVYHTNNLPAYPTKNSWNYDDRYLKLAAGESNPLSGTLYVPRIAITNTAGSDEITFPRANYGYFRAISEGGKIGFITDGKVMSGASVDLAIGNGWVSINNGTSGAGAYNLYVNGSLNAASIYLNGTSLGTAATHNHGDYALSGHTHSYLPLSGGTINGAIYLPAGSFISNGSMQDGHYMVAWSGSGTILGSYQGDTCVRSSGNNLYHTSGSSTNYIILDANNWSNTITLSSLGAAASDHNHDSRYLSLSGGTLSGDLTLYTPSGSPSPRLIWQRAELDGVNNYDWSARDAEGNLYFSIAKGSGWEDKISFTSDDKIYIGSNYVYHSGNLPAYPTKSSWNYDDRYSLLGHTHNYLPLSGGTLSGNITFSHSGTNSPVYISSVSGSYYQRIALYDESATNLPLFKIQESQDSGTTWTDYFTVYKDKATIGNNTIYHTGNLPTYPTVNNGKLTIKANNGSVAEFTANQSGNTDLNITSGSSIGSISVGGTNVGVNIGVSTASTDGLVSAFQSRRVESVYINGTGLYRIATSTRSGVSYISLRINETQSGRLNDVLVYLSEVYLSYVNAKVLDLSGTSSNTFKLWYYYNTSEDKVEVYLQTGLDRTQVYEWALNTGTTTTLEKTAVSSVPSGAVEFSWFNISDASVSGGGSTWGSSISVKINGDTKTLTIPSNPNTDYQVTQTLATSSDTQLRPLLSGGSYSTGETPTFSTLTGTVKSVGSLYCKPSTGDLFLYNPTGGDTPSLYFQRGDFNTSNTFDYRMYGSGGDFFIQNDYGGWNEVFRLQYGDQSAYVWNSKVITAGNYTSYVNTTNYPGLNKTGTVTSITLKAGTGISLDTDNTAITTSGTRTITNTGVRGVSINGDYLRINTNGTNADLTIPYATSSGNSSSLGGYSASHFATVGETYGVNGAIRNSIESQYMLSYALGTIGISNYNTSVIISECTNGGSYSDVITINHNNSRYLSGEVYNWFYTSGHSGKKVKLTITAPQYIKSVGVYICCLQNGYTNGITCISGTTTSVISTWGSWHIISYVTGNAETQKTIEINTTYETNEICIGGFRICYTNAGNLTFPGNAWSSNSVPSLTNSEIDAIII